VELFPGYDKLTPEGDIIVREDVWKGPGWYVFISKRGRPKAKFLLAPRKDPTIPVFPVEPPEYWKGEVVPGKYRLVAISGLRFEVSEDDQARLLGGDGTIPGNFPGTWKYLVGVEFLDSTQINKEIRDAKS
jgi:hypothetical protein